MGIFNKIASLFVEYEEVDDEDEEEEEAPKEEKKEEVSEEKLARKVELPKNIFKAYQEKREAREREELEEEKEREQEKIVEKELPKEEPKNILEEKNSASYFDQVDFHKEPEHEEVEVPKEEPKKEEVFSRVHMFNDNDFYDDDNDYYSKEETKTENEEGDSDAYSAPTVVEQVTKETTTYTKTYYHRPPTKFTPSPIISPVYGILDKNYKKEEIITKKDSHISSSYEKADLDVARSKLLGNRLSEEKKEEKKEEKVKEKKEKKSDNIADKPAVNRITIGDADEYYKDLGLEYNVDYQDNSKDAESRVQRHEETKKDDNLFDLIDSMYKKEE